jgi:hypothetical protein
VEKRPQVAQHQDTLGWHRRHSRRAPWPAQRRSPRTLGSPKQEPRTWGNGGGQRAQRGRVRGAGGGPTLGLGPGKPISPPPLYLYMNKHREGGIGELYL